jgi:AbrB family looped-hinge helix DNA binding protein
MRITSKGQVTIPQDIREKAGFLPHTRVEFVLRRGSVSLRRSRDGAGRGEKIVRHMRGKATIKMSTEQIMALTRGE